jgi:hypothetical protein
VSPAQRRPPAAVAIKGIAAMVAAAISVQNVQNPLPAEFKSDPDLPVIQ